MYVCCRGDLIHHCYGLKVVGLFAGNFLCITIKDIFSCGSSLYLEWDCIDVGAHVGHKPSMDC